MILTIEVNETEAITILTLKNKIYSQRHVLGKGRQPVDKHIWEQMMNEDIYEMSVIDSVCHMVEDSSICEMMCACNDVMKTNKK